MPIRSLSDPLLKKAEEELNETPARITTDIQILRKWLKTQPHLHSVTPTDQWLVAFLRGCKYNIEKTKGKIDMYYTLKATLPEFYANRDPCQPGIQELLKLGLFLPLRNCIKEDSPRIVLVRVGYFSRSSKHLSELVKLALMIIEIMLHEDDNFTIVGEDIIVDCQDISFALLWNWSPSFAMKTMSCSEKALSVRMKSVHIMNAPFFLAPALKLFKMILAAKLKDRIHGHSKGCETLYEHIHRSVLPEEYGGTDGNLQELTDYWKEKVESYRDWFIDENACSDESKRVKQSSARLNTPHSEID